MVRSCHTHTATHILLCKLLSTGVVLAVEIVVSVVEEVTPVGTFLVGIELTSLLKVALSFFEERLLLLERSKTGSLVVDAKA